MTFPTARLPSRWVMVVLAAYAALAAAVLVGSPGTVGTAITAVAVAAAVACAARARAARPDKAAWTLIAGGLAGYAAGFVLVFYAPSTAGAGPFGLNLSDCLSFLLYPCVHAGLYLLSRSEDERRPPGSLLDVVIVLTSASALAVAWVDMAYPDLLAGDPLRVLYALSYPVAGSTLLVVCTLSALSRSAGSKTWQLLAAGFAVMTVGQVAYAAQAVAGTFRFGTWVDLLYVAGPVLVAIAAWQADHVDKPSVTAHRIGISVPTTATVVAVALLAAADIKDVPAAVTVLAAAAALFSVARTLLYVRQEHLLEQARAQAATDDLTGLLNRRALLAGLAGRCPTGSSCTSPGGVLLIELAGLQAVNDSMGATAGERLLRLHAERLVNTMAPAEVTRLDGARFAVIVDDDDDDDDDGGGGEPGRPLATAVRARAAMSRPFNLDGASLDAGARIGVALFDATGPSPEPEEILRRADAALRRAKEPDGRDIEVWDQSLDAVALARIVLLTDLRGALAEGSGQIIAHYQPQFAAQTRLLVGYEALVRWDHPTRGLLSPAVFVDAAEEAGLLSVLTERVLTLSAAYAKAMADAGNAVPISVNLGAPDLLDPALPIRLRSLLRRHGLPPTALRVEVTETVVMSDPEMITGNLEQIRTMGIGIALDDYGTGLSSLSYLRSLPVDELKIDRSFVKDLEGGGANAVIVASTIDLAHALGMTVVAEGVETEDVLALLSAAGCDTIQGFLLGRPAPAVVPAPRSSAAPQAPVPRGAMSTTATPHAQASR